MAIPVGRALFTFGSLRPSPRDPIVIPDVCISGKALPRGNTVKLDLDIPADMIHWSEFHSGVATGSSLSDGGLLLLMLSIVTYLSVTCLHLLRNVIVPFSQITSLHPDPNHNSNPYTLKGREMNCLVMNCPVPEK